VTDERERAEADHGIRVVRADPNRAPQRLVRPRQVRGVLRSRASAADTRIRARSGPRRPSALRGRGPRGSASRRRRCLRLCS
jgi:hypothetical protein